MRHQAGEVPLPLARHRCDLAVDRALHVVRVQHDDRTSGARRVDVAVQPQLLDDDHVGADPPQQPHQGLVCSGRPPAVTRMPIGALRPPILGIGLWPGTEPDAVGLTERRGRERPGLVARSRHRHRSQRRQPGDVGGVAQGDASSCAVWVLLGEHDGPNHGHGRPVPRRCSGSNRGEVVRRVRRPHSMASPPVTRLSYDVVVPTMGRPSLAWTLAAFAEGDGPWPEHVFVVDDRRSNGPALEVTVATLQAPVTLLRSTGHGPAAARNVGWRAGRSTWTAFLDDDVVPRPGWRARLADDLSRLDTFDGGSQGRVIVPRPAGRAPTDWERNVAGLERARWATADMAYRRAALEVVGGFDERFPRAYREDADLALRVRQAGYRLHLGEREVDHPVRPAPWWTSVRAQVGNADDMLMRRLHGRRWREHAETGHGAAAQHVRTTATGVVAVAGLLSGHARRRLVAGIAGGMWLASATAFSARRISPGPRGAAEIASMAATSLAIPPVATWHLARGWLRAHRLVPGQRPAAVLFDRDGTLIADVPYNGDPDKVVPMPGARAALDRLRVAGIRTAVVSNQSGVARGLITEQQVHAVNARTEELLGPLGPWLICYHGPGEGCRCRKPSAGLIEQAAATLGVEPTRCAVIGDVGADVDSATSIGATAILVPNAATRPAEIDQAAIVAGDLSEAVDLLIGPRR